MRRGPVGAPQVNKKVKAKRPLNRSKGEDTMPNANDIITLTTAYLSSEHISFFQKRGCIVDEVRHHHCITCPQGTVRQPLSRLINPWDELTFPDGTIIRVGLLPTGQSIFVTRI
jgi:hypothetical protein